jgi:hypothetical protein
MSGTRSIRYATIVALGALAILWQGAGAAPPPDTAEGLKADAAEVLEVKVLEAQTPQGQGERFDVLYHMEVLSVLRSASRGVQPGDTITVRSYGQSKETLERGWTGTAYLNRDPKASGPDAGLQFVIAEQGGSLVKLPPTPPSLRFTPMAPADGQ